MAAAAAHLWVVHLQISHGRILPGGGRRASAGAGALACWLARGRRCGRGGCGGQRGKRGAGL